MASRILIDCDPGIDDGLALYAALGSHAIRLQAVTTVFGNVRVKQATRNVARLLRLVPHAPVLRLAEGHDQPLTGSRLPQRVVHGQDGLGDVGVPIVPSPHTRLDSTALMVELLGAEALDQIVALGPLTNLAHVYASAPRLLQRLRAIVVMAGVIAGRGGSSATEFNLASDPAAGRCLLRSQAPLRWVPMDVAASVVLTPEAIGRFRATHPRHALAGTIAALLCAIGRARGMAGAVVPDAVALMLAIEPDLGVWRQRRLALAGRTRSGRLSVETGVPNAQVCEAVREAQVAERLWALWSKLVRAGG